MDNNYFMWSCNKKKFSKIFTARERYKERLGWKLNSEWDIEIKFSFEYNKSSFFDGAVEDTICSMFLSRNNDHEDVQVLFRSVINSNVEVNRQLIFKIGTSKQFIYFTKSKDFKEYLTNFIFIFPKNNNPENITEYPFLTSKDCNLRDDLLTMLENERFSDVTLKCNSEILKAHKSILSARSPVFETMFNSPMQESEAGMVVIKDMSPGTFRSMMYFVYGGEIQITSLTSACDLLYAAEKYQLKGLKHVCLEYLKTVLTTENSIQVLEKADLYDVKLKRHAISFIKDHFEDLESTKDWRELKQRKPVLALEVYSSEE